MILLLKFLNPFTKTFMISLVYKTTVDFCSGINKQMLIVHKSNVANCERVDMLVPNHVRNKAKQQLPFFLFFSLVSSLKFWLRFRLYFHL